MTGEFLLRDTEEYGETVDAIMQILATVPLSHVEALGVLDICRDEIHLQRYDGGEEE